ncbi:MAG: hypothetical protein HFE77_07800 [Clostridiales bacterium]|nr:hypothetical protein [Clostridiales bacterium]
MKKFSYITLLLAASFLFCSCGSQKMDYQTYKETSKTQHENGLSNQDIVMTIDGHDICYAEFRYYFLAELNLLGQDTWSSFTNEEKQSFSEEKVVHDLLFERSAAKLAEQHGVTLDKQEIEGIESYIQEAINNAQGEDAFTHELEKLYLTPSLYRFITFQDQLMTKLYSFYTNEATTPLKADDAAIVKAAQDGELIHIKHIFIKNDPDDNIEQNEVLAQTIYEKAKSGESFEELISQYSEDPALEQEPDGVHIFRHEMNDAFDQAAFSLEIGEMSQVVPVYSDTYSGFHILKRYEPDSAYVDKNMNTLRQNYMASQFYSEIEKLASKANITFKEKLQTLLPDQID